ALIHTKQLDILRSRTLGGLGYRWDSFLSHEVLETPDGATRSCFWSGRCGFLEMKRIAGSRSARPSRWVFSGMRDESAGAGRPPWRKGAKDQAWMITLYALCSEMRELGDDHTRRGLD